MTDDTGSNDKENDPKFVEPLPHKKLCVAIMNTIASNPSEETEKALANSKKCKQFQASQGEILTTPEMAERLLQEAKDRDAKKKNKNPDKAQKQLVFEEPDKSKRDESDDETELQTSVVQLQE